MKEDRICQYCGGIITRNRSWQHYKTRKYCSHKCAQMGDSNSYWKGDNLGYEGLHYRIRTMKPKPDLCERCKSNPPLDLSSKDSSYTLNPDDWEWLCRKCHMTVDGRLDKRDQSGKFKKVEVAKLS